MWRQCQKTDLNRECLDYTANHKEKVTLAHNLQYSTIFELKQWFIPLSAHHFIIHQLSKKIINLQRVFFKKNNTLAKSETWRTQHMYFQREIAILLFSGTATAGKTMGWRAWWTNPNVENKSAAEARPTTPLQILVLLSGQEGMPRLHTHQDYCFPSSTKQTDKPHLDVHLGAYICFR